MVIVTRFRNLPDEQMKHIVDYVESGRPIIGMRTATHAFNLQGQDATPDTRGTARRWDGGFGRQVLGETWVNHHGEHGKQSTRGSSPRGRRTTRSSAASRTATSGGRPTSTPSDLPLPGDSKPLVLGQVLDGHEAGRPAARRQEERPDDAGRLDQDLQGRVRTRPGGVFTTTMGASQDLASEGVRRLLVNACYWAVGLEDKIPEKSDVSLVGEYKPTPFGFGKFRKGVKPSDLSGR